MLDFKKVISMNHIGTKPLETDRLILRRFTLEDAAAVYKNWASDEEVTKFLMWKAHHDIAVTETVVKNWVQNYKEKTYYHWAICYKSYSSEPIGDIAVMHSDDTIKMAHIGYHLGKNWWHMGITSEALQCVMDYLFDEVGFYRIESRHDPRNPNSGGVMKKCGMKYEGTHRQADWNNQGVCDASYYALLANER